MVHDSIRNSKWISLDISIYEINIIHWNMSLFFHFPKKIFDKISQFRGKLNDRLFQLTLCSNFLTLGNSKYINWEVFSDDENKISIKSATFHLLSREIQPRNKYIMNFNCTISNACELFEHSKFSCDYISKIWEMEVVSSGTNRAYTM